MLENQLLNFVENYLSAWKDFIKNFTHKFINEHEIDEYFFKRNGSTRPHKQIECTHEWINECMCMNE